MKVLSITKSSFQDKNTGDLIYRKSNAYERLKNGFNWNDRAKSLISFMDENQ